MYVLRTEIKNARRGIRFSCIYATAVGQTHVLNCLVSAE